MNQRKDSKYFLYVDGLKAVACLMIVCYHYLALYRDAIVFNPSIPWVDRFAFSPVFGFLTDSGQGFWNYLFFIASGFLISGKKTRTVLNLVKNCLMRFFRFALPLLFSCAVIWLISTVFGFHNSETSSLFENPWFQTAYRNPITILDIIRAPVDVLLFGRSQINSPYWVISGMFYASLLIYFLQFLTRSLSDTWRLVIFLAAAVCLFFCKKVISACLFGAVTRQLSDLLSVNRKTSGITLFFSILSIFLYMWVIYRRPNFAVFFFICFFVAFFLFVDKTQPAKKLFSSRFLVWLSSLSWEIYSFHWPILCSVGSLFLLSLSPHLGLPVAYGLSCLTCVFLTLLISILYHHSLAKLSSDLNAKINAMLSNTFSKHTPGA